MFAPIRTERLVVRTMTSADTDSLWERRNHPDVARYQNWEHPFGRDRAEQLVDGVAAMDGPEAGEWWMAVVTDASTGETCGDLALHLSGDGNTAEVGYTFHPDHWGMGYAVEALDGLIGYLFETLEVTRVFGMLHPDNRASAQVLERCGFLFEGHTRKSFWLAGEVSDDWLYGLLREEWEAWRDRPRHRPDRVELVEVTRDNFQDVYELRTHRTQQAFVAPMPRSLSQALVPPVRHGHDVAPWYRAIVADGEVVGFVMVALVEHPSVEPFLWRLLIDRMHQRRGIGAAAMALLESEMRAMGAAALVVSWEPGRGSPEQFHRGLGYEPTGEVYDGEVEGRKVL